jgi:hypothetical protein
MRGKLGLKSYLPEFRAGQGEVNAIISGLV